MPAISRPFLIALVAAVLALVAFYATRSADGGDDSAAVPTTAPVAPAEEPATEPTAKAGTDAPGASTAGKTGADGPAAKRAENASAAPDGAGPDTDRARRRGADAGLPRPVARALAGRGKVVIFFYRPGSADDRATARAVARLRGQPGISVFSAPVDRLADYRAIVDGVGISQTPAVVIVAGDGTARVVQGYIDPATLAQDVADTR